MKGSYKKRYAQMMDDLVPDEDIARKTAQEEDISVTHHCPDCGGPLGFTLEFDDQGYPIWNCKACNKTFPENELPEEKTAQGESETPEVFESGMPDHVLRLFPPTFDGSQQAYCDCGWGYVSTGGKPITRDELMRDWQMHVQEQSKTASKMKIGMDKEEAYRLGQDLANEFGVRVVVVRAIDNENSYGVYRETSADAKSLNSFRSDIVDYLEPKTAANLDPSREFLMGQCGACANGFEWGDGAHVYCPILDAPKHYMESCNENLVGMPKPQRPENEACLKKIKQAAAGLRDAMVEHARQMFPEADDSDIEAALYWFASDNHEGQWSDLYSILSTSPYTPGRLMTSVEDEGEMAEMIYEVFENMGQQFTQAAKKTAQDSEHMYAAVCPECGGQAGHTGKGDWYECEQCKLQFDPKLDARMYPETVQDIEDSRAFKGAGMIPISQIERGVYDVALAAGRVQGEQDVMSAWATASEIAAYFENTSEDEIMDAVSRDSTLKLEGDKISFADNPLSFTDEKGKTRPRASMDTWGKFSKYAYKLQDHGDGTYDVLDSQGNVVISQESYQVASNFVEGSPRGEYSETDEVRDVVESKQADQEADPIEKARQLGEQAFLRGDPSNPASDSELMAMLEGNQVGEGLPLLDAWSEGWHGANVGADVPGWTSEENQALRDARGARKKQAYEYPDSSGWRDESGKFDETAWQTSRAKLLEETLQIAEENRWTVKVRNRETNEQQIEFLAPDGRSFSVWYPREGRAGDTDMQDLLEAQKMIQQGY